MKKAGHRLIRHPAYHIIYSLKASSLHLFSIELSVDQRLLI